MTKFSITRRAGYTMCLLFALAFGCNDDEGRTRSTPPTAEDEGVMGNKLARINLANNAVIRFYELGPGGIAIRYSRPVGEESNETGLKLDELISQKADAVSIYKKLSPVLKEDDLEVLNSAIERQEDRAKNFEKYNDFKLASKGARSLSEVELEEPALESSVGRACNAGPDDYESLWFRDNYCNWGAFRECDLKYHTTFITTQASSQYRACGMAADYDPSSKTHFWGRYVYRGYWLDAWDHALYNGQVECWYLTRNSHYNQYGDKKKAVVGPYNSDDCSISHLSAGWFMD